MRSIAIVLACVCLSAGVAYAAQPQFLVGEGVSASPTMKKSGWRKNCIVQGGPSKAGLFSVKCGTEVFDVDPRWIKSNPDQTKTSRRFVCPGQGKPCYFKP